MGVTYDILYNFFVSAGAPPRIAALSTNSILTTHRMELAGQVESYVRVIEPDQFADQQGAFDAGVDDAAAILRGEISVP